MNLPLTNPFGERGRDYARTLPGQASWADGEHKCFQCVHWILEGRYSLNGKHRGGLKPGPCAKYKALMREWGPKVPYHATSCKHFEKNPEAPRP